MPLLPPVIEPARRKAAAWLPAATDAKVVALCQRGLADIGICEMPPGSNRSGRIDEYNRAAGVALGSYWCGSAVGAWHRDVELEVPAGYASCDRWLAWAKETGRWNPVKIPGGNGKCLRDVVPGAKALYGQGNDAQHIALVVRVEPLVFTVDGNTTVSPHYSRNGVAVDMKQIDVPTAARLLGFVHPFPLD